MKGFNKMRKSIIIGNWKMNKNLSETLNFIKEIEPKCKHLNMDAGVAVPFIYLKEAKKNAKNLIIAAQNCYFEDSGAFTGEVSVNMLKDIGITHIIIGHSERREIFHETDELINQKNKAILEKGLIPIVCCGETLAQYNKKETLKVVYKQLEKAYKDISKELVEKSVIAYEPIWAIGTGKTATAEIAQNICKAIREKISKLYDNETAQKIRIQYGGSVKPDNIEELLSQPDIDGALVGGASLEGSSFIQLIE